MSLDVVAYDERCEVYEAISTAERSSTWRDKQTPTQTDSGLVLEHNPGAQQGRVKLTVVEPVPTGSELKGQQ